MKALLICPAPRQAVSALAESAPLAAVPLLGESLLAYWLVHLAQLGAKDVTVLACDRPGAIWQLTGDGARWGLRVSVIAQLRELSATEAREQYGTGSQWLPAPHDIVLIDHLPGRPDLKIFESYAAWFHGVQEWLPHARTPDRVGVREVEPGVHVGWHSRIPVDATLRAPCWIGEKVFVGAGATIGPRAVIEDRAVIDPGAEVVDSVVGPETLVGRETEVRGSIALGDTLVNWQTGSCLRVSDEFLLCPLRKPERPADTAGEWLRRLTRPLMGESTPPLLPAQTVAVMPPSSGLPQADILTS